MLFLIKHFFVFVYLDFITLSFTLFTLHLQQSLIFNLRILTNAIFVYINHMFNFPLIMSCLLCLWCENSLLSFLNLLYNCSKFGKTICLYFFNQFIYFQYDIYNKKHILYSYYYNQRFVKINETIFVVLDRIT